MLSPEAGENNGYYEPSNAERNKIVTSWKFYKTKFKKLLIFIADSKKSYFYKPMSIIYILHF